MKRAFFFLMKSSLSSLLAMVCFALAIAAGGLFLPKDSFLSDISLLYCTSFPIFLTIFLWLLCAGLGNGSLSLALSLGLTRQNFHRSVLVTVPLLVGCCWAAQLGLDTAVRVLSIPVSRPELVPSRNLTLWLLLWAASLLGLLMGGRTIRHPIRSGVLSGLMSILLVALALVVLYLEPSAPGWGLLPMVLLLMSALVILILSLLLRRTILHFTVR